MCMYRSKLRTWSIFAGWLVVGAFCGVLDREQESTRYLPVFLVCSIVMVVVATWKRRPPNYRFELVSPGVVRSRYGFEVRVSDSRLQDAEGDRTISWQVSPGNGLVGRFRLSQEEINGWDDPFASVPMDSVKKREIVRAIASAILYLQLVDAGKIRPKQCSPA